MFSSYSDYSESRILLPSSLMKSGIPTVTSGLEALEGMNLERFPVFVSEALSALEHTRAVS